MTFIVITVICIALIIARIIYQHQRNVSITYYIQPILGLLVIINLAAVAAVVHTDEGENKSRDHVQEDYTIAIDISESMKADVQTE